MHSPIVPRIRQGFAQPSQRAAKIVVTVGAVGHTFPHAGCLSHGPRLCRDCTPSPLTRPVPLWGRSGLFPQGRDGRTLADMMIWTRAGHGFRFPARLVAVKSAATTTQRGIEPCVSILSSSPLRPRPLRAACRPRPSAAWPAPWPVLPSRTQRMRTWLQAQPSARWLVRRPAVCRACRPAAATDLIAAPRGRFDTNARPSGHAAPVAFVISAPRPGCGGRGERCSRKS